MVQPVDPKKFLDGFQGYLQSRGIDETSTNSIKATYLEINENPDLVNKLQAMRAPANVDWQSFSPFAMSIPGNFETISYSHLLYIYLNAILNGDIEKAEQFWALADYDLDYRLDPSIINAYYRIRLALAYDYETKQFGTDQLLLNVTKLTKENKAEKAECLFYPDVCPCYDSNQQYNYDDYRVENAINYIAILVTKEQEKQQRYAGGLRGNDTRLFFSTLLPLRLIFSHPQQNNATHEFGFHLLRVGATPKNILDNSKQNASNDYRLLNHCVEMYAATLKAELYVMKDTVKLYVLFRDYPYIPAAKIYSDINEYITQAAKANYKPAIAHLLRLGKLKHSTVPSNTRLDQLLLLWQENYLSTAETFNSIARECAEEREDRQHQSEFELPYITSSPSSSETARINDLSLTISAGTECFVQRVQLLATLCTAHRLIFDYRFRDITIGLNKFFDILRPILALSKSEQDRLQKWMDTAFGELIIKEYLYHCMSFTLHSEIGKCAHILITTLMSCNPYTLSAWQKELLYKRLARVLPFTQALETAYQALKTLQDKHATEIAAEATPSTPFSIPEIVFHILRYYSIPYLLTSRLRQVNKHFRSAIDVVFLKCLQSALTFNDKIIALNHYTRIFYLACVSNNNALREMNIHYFNQLQKWQTSPPPTLNVDLRIALLNYSEQAQRAAVAAGSTEIIQMFINKSDNNFDLIPELFKFNNVPVIAHVTRIKAMKPAHVDHQFLTLFIYLYINEYISGKLSKERYADCIFIIQNLLLRMHPIEMESYFQTTLIFQDWQLLTMLCRFDPEYASALIKMAVSNTHAAPAKSFMYSEECTVSSNAPKWWQDQQKSCFDQLVKERKQLLLLCQELIEDLEKLPAQPSVAVMNTLGNHAPQAKSTAHKNDFVLALQNLRNDLTAHNIDAINGTLKAIDLIHDYRSKLIENDNKGYLRQMNIFFNLPENYITITITKEVEKRLIHASAEEPECSTRSNLLMMSRVT